MDEKKEKLQLRCVVSEEPDGTCCALCLDLDIATEGDTIEEAMVNLQEAVLLYLNYALESGAFSELVPRPVPDISDWLRQIEEARENRGLHGFTLPYTGPPIHHLTPCFLNT